MDGTLLEGRTISALAKKVGVEKKLVNILDDDSMFGYERTERITSMFSGLDKKEVLRIVKSMKLTRNCEKTIQKIKEKGIVTGIVSDSYTIITKYIAKKLGLDFAVANELDIDSNGLITGRVFMPQGWEKINCFCNLSVCKRYHLEETAKKFDIPVSKTIAIGDTISDLCMIKKAGLGIAFLPDNQKLADNSDIVIRERDFSLIADLIKV